MRTKQHPSWLQRHFCNLYVKKIFTVVPIGMRKLCITPHRSFLFTTSVCEIGYDPFTPEADLLSLGCVCHIPSESKDTYTQSVQPLFLLSLLVDNLDVGFFLLAFVSR